MSVISYYILTQIQFLRTLGNIHWNFKYEPLDDNDPLYYFSFEKYQEVYDLVTPSKKNINYYIADFTIKYGDWLFGNISKYEQVCLLLCKESLDESLILFKELPVFYQKEILGLYPEHQETLTT